MKARLHLFKFLVVLFCVGSFSISTTKAQDNSGTEFWFTPFAEDFLDHLAGVYIVSYYDCQVTIDYVARNPANDFAGDPQCTQNVVNVTGGVPLYVDVPFDAQANCWRYADTLEAPEVVRNNGIKVTSTAPIALYSQFLMTASSEMTPILPIEEMGKEYIVNAYREITDTSNNFNARTTVIGIEDNTNITFTLPTYCWTSSVDNNGNVTHAPGSSWSVTLNKGQTYTVLSNDNGLDTNITPAGASITVNENQGLNGMRISADKNISVLGGTDCTWIGNDEYAGCGACDLTCEHLKPMENWGTRFVSTQTLQRNTRSTTALRNPPAPNIEPYPAASIERSVADYLMITAKDNGTIINITGDFDYTKNLNAGEWFIYESPGNANLAAPPSVSPGRANHIIEANNPIEVTQMMKGWQCDNNQPADPTQMMVREEDTWEDNYIVSNPTQYVNNFFVFIIEEPNGADEARTSLNLNVNGVDVNVPNVASPTFDGTGGWSQMGTTAYYYQRVNVAAGGAIRAKSVPLTPGGVTYPFGFYASGSTNASSYGYMGGNVCKLEAFAHADTANICLGDPVTFVLDSTRYGGTVASVVTYDYQWTYLSGNDTVYEFSGSGFDPTHSYTPTTPPDSAGVYEGYLYITDNAGCSAVDTFTVVINATIPGPVVGPDVTICEGNDINLSASSSVDTVTYNWSGPLSYTSNDQNPVITNSTVDMSGVYSVSVSKNGCTSDTVEVSVTVNSNDTLSLTSTAGTDTQEVCENVAINNIVYTMSGGATSISSSGLPPGVTGSFVGGIYTITGTPTDTGVFNYVVFTSGICVPDTLIGSIIVNPDASIALTSAAGTDAQDICFNSSITDITYDVAGGGSGASASGLPNGVAGNYSGGVFTISGTPTETGTFNYTINTTGTCVQTSATGSITIGENDTIMLSSVAGTDGQTICLNESIDNITYDVTGGATDAIVTGLPTGLTGTYAGGVFTISGTPTQDGTFNYTVNTVGTCTKDSAQGSIIINPMPVIDSIPFTNESACGANDGSITVHASGTGLTYSIDGGATYVGSNIFNGLMAGSYNVMVQNGSNCSVDGGVISISSAGAPPEPTAVVNSNALCEGDTLILTVQTPVGGETYNWVGPDSYTATGDSVFILGVAPSMAGTYTLTASVGPCVSPGNSVSVDIDPNASISLTSAAGSDTQNICVNNNIDNITYDIGGGGTGATVTGLPTGVTGSFAGGVYIISGTPTQTGVFNYTVNTTGSCAQTSAAGTITVNEDAAIALTSAAGTDAQTVCENVAITDVTYDVTGGGTDATATGLPTGLVGSFAGGVFIISGTPTQTGVFNYTINTTGNCAQTSAAGTITVNEDAVIAITSAAGTDAQDICVNSTISTITYDVTGGGTGATVTGLPTGVTGVFNSGVFSISGTPTQTGVFNYTVNTTGNCAQTSAVGTITVNEDAAIALTSAAGTDAQAVCENVAITDITYDVTGGGTDAAATGLPTGLIGSFAGGVFTISGTPTQTGVFNYTVNTTGSCAQTSAVGTITVNQDAAIALTSSGGTDAQAICENTSITDITYDVTGGGTGANVSGLPTGVTGSFTGGVFAISGTPAQTGVFNYTVNTTGSCAQTSISGSINVNDCSVPIASFTASSLSVCVGDTVLFTDNSTGTNINDWQWTIDGGNPGTAITQGPHSVIFASAGSFNITLQVTDDNGSDDTTVILVVNDLPTVVANASSISICTGDPVTLTGAGAQNYSWNNGVQDGVAFNPSATDTYTVVGTDVNGCVNSDDVTVSVNSCDVPVASFTASSTSICIGETIEFTDNSTGMNVNSWNWTFDGGDPSSANTQGSHIVAFNTVGNFDITLTITDDNGTDDTTITVVVNDLPTVVANASATTICEGESVTLSGGGAQSYVWDNGAQDGAAFVPTNTATYTVVGTSINGCENSASVTVEVETCSTPVASFTASSLTICEGESITFTDNSTGGVTGWNWTFNGGTPASANTQGAHTVTFGASGVYSVLLEVTNPNGTDQTSVSVTVNPNPAVTFITTDDNCEESTGTITGVVIAGVEPLTYNWDNGASDSLLTGLAAGTYNVLISDAAGCTSSTDVVIGATADDCKYIVYVPNVFSPNNDGNNDVFYVTGKGINSMNIKIFNRWGNKVYESSDIEEGWDGTYNGKVQNTAVFVYVLDVFLENGDRITESGNVSIVK